MDTPIPTKALQKKRTTNKMKTSRIFQSWNIAFFSAVLISLVTTPCFAAYNVWLDNTLTKYRQDGEDGTSGSTSLSITMAKNEIESFQVMLYADGESLSNVNVTVSKLTKGNDTLDDIYLYKQHYHMTKSIDVKGVVGDWEDLGGNVWRKNIGSTPYVYNGEPGSMTYTQKLHHQSDVGFFVGGLGATNWHNGLQNTSTLSALYEWKYDGTYLHVFSPSNPATYFSGISAPNRRSRIDYPSGMYPDALLPKVDRYYQETRNTFPFTVASGKVQGVWVDVGTTTTTSPGTYTGTVTVTAEGKSPVTRTVNVVVKDFAMPSTSMFDTSFVFEQSMMTHGHGWGQLEGQTGTTRSVDLAKVYGKSFLYHKTSPVFSGVNMNSPEKMPWNSGTKTLSVANWEPWYSEVKDIYDGTAISSGPYSGAKSKTKRPPAFWPVESRSDIAIADKATANVQYHQLVFNKLTSEGWDPFNTMVVGVYQDEPQCTHNTTWRGATVTKCAAAIAQGQEIASINTGGLGIFKRAYVNSKLRVGLEDFANYGFYSASIYGFVCPGWDRTCSNGGTKVSRDAYPNYPNDSVWGYYACDETGCWQTGGIYTINQTDWSADAPSILNRFAGWLWAKYDLTGTVYYATNECNLYETGDIYAGRPYDSIWQYGQHGAGQLLYPGVADGTGRTIPTSTPIIGGTHDIPIESIRLKHIRDAIEDWEYVQMAKAKAGKEATFSALDGAFTDADINVAYWKLNTDVSNFLTIRDHLADLITNTTPRGLDDSIIITRIILKN